MNTSNRRDFLKRAATGTAGLAVLPNVRFPEFTTRPTELPKFSGAVDEAYWRDVKAQFIVRDGFIMMNAANC